MKKIFILILLTIFIDNISASSECSFMGLYGADSSNNSLVRITINGTEGMYEKELIGEFTNAQGTVTGLAFSPDGSVLYACTDKGVIHTVNPETGAVTGIITTFSAAYPMDSLETKSNGNILTFLWDPASQQSQLYEITSEGVKTAIGFPIGIRLSGISFAYCSENFLYAVKAETIPIQVFYISPYIDNFSYGQLAPVNLQNPVGCLASDDIGRQFTVENNGRMWQFVLTPIGPGCWSDAYHVGNLETAITGLANRPYIPTPTPTNSPTPSPTCTSTPTPTASPSPAPTPTPSPSPTQTSTPTPSPTPTPAITPTQTPSYTPTLTPTPTTTNTPTPTPTTTPDNTPTSTQTPISSPTITPTPTETSTPLPSPTPSPSPTQSQTPVPTPTATPSPTLTPTPSITPLPPFMLAVSFDADLCLESLYFKDNEIMRISAYSKSIDLIEITSQLPDGVDIDAIDYITRSQIFISLDRDVILNGIYYADEDLIYWNGKNFKMGWDGTQNGLNENNDIDAVDILSFSPLSFIFSLEEDCSLPINGVLTLISDEDLITYKNNLGFTDIFFDGTLYGIAESADLNSVSFLSNNKWGMSFDIPCIIDSLYLDDGDIILWDSHTRQFENKAYFRGSDYMLPEYLNVNGFEGNESDILKEVPSADDIIDFLLKKPDGVGTDVNNDGKVDIGDVISSILQNSN